MFCRKLSPIPIDVFDAHRRDHLSQLPEMMFFCLLFDLRRIETQQADRRVLHDLRLDSDRHGKDAGNFDANVLGRESVFERDADLDRLEFRNA